MVVCSFELFLTGDHLLTCPINVIDCVHSYLVGLLVVHSHHDQLIAFLVVEIKPTVQVELLAFVLLLDVDEMAAVVSVTVRVVSCVDLEHLCVPDASHTVLYIAKRLNVGILLYQLLPDCAYLLAFWKMVVKSRFIHLWLDITEILGWVGIWAVRQAQ